MKPMTREQILAFLRHPNTLTMGRVLAIPGVIVLLIYPNRFTAFLAAILFSAAAITDALDGFYARRMGLVSNFGKMMDPLADKLLVSSAFIMMVSLGWVPGWMACVIIGREIAITGLRALIAENREDVSASMLGKYKTGFQIAAIIPLLLHYRYLGIDFHVVGTVLLWMALGITIWSGADYFIRFRKFFQN